MASQASALCAACDTAATKLCGECGSVRYCSIDCQKTDWSTHKLLCKSYSSFDATSRPSNEHYKAILFPIDSAKPQVVWIHAPLRGGGLFEGHPYQAPEIAPFLGEDSMPWSMAVQYNGVLQRRFSNTIMIGYRETFLVDGSKRNRSIERIHSTKPGQYHDWRGPIIVYSMAGVAKDPVACRDVNMYDFRNATDFFLTYNSVSVNESLAPGPDGVVGIRINCEGDQKMCNRPKFEKVEIPRDHPIFFNHDTSDVAERIGLPIYSRTYQPNPIWSEHGGSEFVNEHASMLHLCLDPKAKFNMHTGVMGFGWIHRKWMNSVGSVLVVRQDKKPLSILDVEALSKYCIEDVQPLFAHYNGEYAESDPLTSDAILGMICRPIFANKWRQLHEASIKAGNGITQFPVAL